MRHVEPRRAHVHDARGALPLPGGEHGGARQEGDEGPAGQVTACLAPRDRLGSVDARRALIAARTH